MKTRYRRAKYGYGREYTFIRGNAKGALDPPADPNARRCIEELLTALDVSIPEPLRAVDKPLLMAIEGVHLRLMSATGCRNPLWSRQFHRLAFQLDGNAPCGPACGVLWGPGARHPWLPD